MTILSTVIALAALAGLAAVWLRLRTVNKAVEHLAQIHGSPAGDKAVEFKGLSQPPFVFSDEATSRAVVTQNLIVLGYRNDLDFDLTNQSNAHNAAPRDVIIGVPAGTTIVVPLLTGFILMYGKLTVNSNGLVTSVSVEDHHLGLEALGIQVVSLANDTATLRVTSLLMDKNGDDKWSGVAYASALFLGPHP